MPPCRTPARIWNTVYILQIFAISWVTSLFKFIRSLPVSHTRRFRLSFYSSSSTEHVVSLFNIPQRQQRLISERAFHSFFSHSITWHDTRAVIESRRANIASSLITRTANAQSPLVINQISHFGNSVLCRVKNGIVYNLYQIAAVSSAYICQLRRACARKQFKWEFNKKKRKPSQYGRR